MSTALVRLCDTPKEIARALHWPVQRFVALDWATGPDQPVVMQGNVRVPLLFGDGIHDDTEAVFALYAGEWYYDIKRDKIRRCTSRDVFISGPHLISRPLTMEMRRRTYTDRPNPFVMSAYPLSKNPHENDNG